VLNIKKKVFVAPYRNPEERKERRRLVQLLREKRQKKLEKHHYISRGAVCSTENHSEHVINTRNNTSADEDLQDLRAHFQLLDKSFSERLSERIDESFANINR
jgi:hypothetical protein